MHGNLPTRTVWIHRPPTRCHTGGRRKIDSNSVRCTTRAPTMKREIFRADGVRLMNPMGDFLVLASSAASLLRSRIAKDVDRLVGSTQSVNRGGKLVLTLFSQMKILRSSLSDFSFSAQFQRHLATVHIKAFASRTRRKSQRKNSSRKFRVKNRNKKRFFSPSPDRVFRFHLEVSRDFVVVRMEIVRRCRHAIP